MIDLQLIHCRRMIKYVYARKVVQQQITRVAACLLYKTMFGVVLTFKLSCTEKAHWHYLQWLQDTWMKCKTMRRKKEWKSIYLQAFEQYSNSLRHHHILTCNLILFTWKRNIIQVSLYYNILRMIFPAIFVAWVSCRNPFFSRLKWELD